MPVSTTIARCVRLLTASLAIGALAPPPAAGGHGSQDVKAGDASSKRGSAQSHTAAEALDVARRAYDARQHDAARPLFTRALELARAEGNREIEGRALRGLGGVALRQANYAAAKPDLERALTIFEEIGVTRHRARTLNDLAIVEFHLNQRPAAREHYRQALAAFEELGDLTEQANLHYNLLFVTDDKDESLRLIERGLGLAKRAKALAVEGNLLQASSEMLFDKGDLSGAMQRIDEAIVRFEAAGAAARDRLALGLTSKGRLLRAHGQHRQALETYRDALQLQEAVNDRRGIIQSLNAIGMTLGYLERHRDALQYFERALEHARHTGSAWIIEFQTANLAHALIDTGDAARGVAMLEEVVRQLESPGRQALHQEVRNYYGQLSWGYLELGRHAQAAEAASRAIAAANAGGLTDRLQNTLGIRARAYSKLGRGEDALADAREALSVIERVRARVVPTDVMKGGYADQHQELFTLNIELLHELGRHREALDIAEQARARAFADLLATREGAAGPPAIVARQTGATGSSESGEAALPGSVAARGGGDARSSRETRRPGRDLHSTASAAPLTARELVDVAARRGSTVVSYWVGPEMTYIWVIASSGEVASVRVDVTRRRLASLVRQTWTVTDRPKRGEEASPGPGASPESLEPAIEGAEPPADESDGETPIGDAAEAWSPRVRGIGLVTLGEGARIASRALHRLLVEPITHLLPSEPGSLLTIIPHRELFQLSFAALLDRSGAYLVERHALHYVPAGVVLQLTEKQRAAPSRTPRYLLVADPGTLPAARDGQPLPPLPGTRREVAGVARLVRASRVTSLTGASAIEPTVRRLMGDRTVLHFATHGVVRADDPLESFLALDTGRPVRPPAARSGAGSRGRDATAPLAASTAADGRLTSWEIYGLDLRADLVVLSACRTGVGRVSGDGVVGLARAFLYAGTPSVVATLWDVADEPAAQLMPRFYRALAGPAGKARALRQAQLALLRDLRAGKVQVSAGPGRVTLPEHPVLWASFILVGEP